MTDNTKIYNEHSHCEVAIRWKTCKDMSQRPGLFCSKHNVYIKWLRPEHAWELIDQFGVEVEPYKDLAKKSQRTQAPDSRLRQLKRQKDQRKKLKRKNYGIK